jgi:hypothetical protein
VRNTNLLAPATPLAPLLFTAASRTTHVPTTIMRTTLVHRSAQAFFREFFFEFFSSFFQVFFGFFCFVKVAIPS